MRAVLLILTVSALSFGGAETLLPFTDFKLEVSVKNGKKDTDTFLRSELLKSYRAYVQTWVEKVRLSDKRNKLKSFSIGDHGNVTLVEPQSKLSRKFYAFGDDLREDENPYRNKEYGIRRSKDNVCQHFGFIHGVVRLDIEYKKEPDSKCGQGITCEKTDEEVLELRRDKGSGYTAYKATGKNIHKILSLKCRMDYDQLEEVEKQVDAYLRKNGKEAILVKNIEGKMVDVPFYEIGRTIMNLDEYDVRHKEIAAMKVEFKNVDFNGDNSVEVEHPTALIGGQRYDFGVLTVPNRYNKSKSDTVVSAFCAGAKFGKRVGDYTAKESNKVVWFNKHPTQAKERDYRTPDYAGQFFQIEPSIYEESTWGLRGYLNPIAIAYHDASTLKGLKRIDTARCSGPLDKWEGFVEEWLKEQERLAELRAMSSGSSGSTLPAKPTEPSGGKVKIKIIIEISKLKAGRYEGKDGDVILSPRGKNAVWVAHSLGGNLFEVDKDKLVNRDGDELRILGEKQISIAGEDFEISAP